MPTISGGTIIEGSGSQSGIPNAGAPVDGTDEVQTITIGGTPEAGDKITVGFEGMTAQADWSATNATLIANLDAALESLPTIGTGGVTTAVGTMTAGVGTATVTFTAQNGKKAVGLLTVAITNADGDGSVGTIAVAETTPGVRATGRGAPKGSLLTDTTNAILYINTGTDTAPTWTKVGTQT